MKYAISLIFCLGASASPIQIFYEGDPRRAGMVKGILVDAYSVPEVLIALQRVERCEQLSVGGKMDLCLKSNGDLLEVSVDREFIDGSLKIFRAP